MGKVFDFLFGSTQIGEREVPTALLIVAGVIIVGLIFGLASGDIVVE